MTANSIDRFNIALLLTFASLLVCAGLWWAYDYTMDDTLITLRYSMNLVETGAPIWNPLDRDYPSMGFTSTLWMLVNSMTGLLTTGTHDNYVLFSKIFGCFALIGFAFILIKVLDEQGVSLKSGALFIGLILINPVLGFHTSSGMETILFGTSVAAFVYLIIRKQNYYVIVALGFLLYLVRPEGGLLTFIFWLTNFIQERRYKQSVIAAFALGSLLVLYHLSVYRFFGDPLPAPFYTKVATGSFIKVSSVFYTALFYSLAALPFLVVTLPLWKQKKFRFAIISILTITIFFLMVFPTMNVLYRYQLPILFLLILLTAYGWNNFLAGGRLKKSLAAGALAFSYVFNYGVADMYIQKVGRQLGHNLQQVGEFLQPYDDKESWMTFGDAGYVPFYSNFNTIDVWGLNNRDIATNVKTIADFLSDDKVTLALRYRAAVPRSTSYALLDLPSYGFEYCGEVQVVNDGRSQLWLQFYSKDPLFDQQDLARIPVNLDFQGSWFLDVYYFGKDIRYKF